MTNTLWRHWYQAIAALRPAFSRQQTFMWFAVCVAGMSVRTDNLGVSSIVRALALKDDAMATCWVVTTAPALSYLNSPPCGHGPC